MRKTLGLAFVVVLALTTAAGAAPLDLKQVAADAKWAAHLDVDALMASTMVQKARAQMLKEHPEAEAHLAMVRTIWKFDPTTDIHGITIYGSQLKKATGVAIVRAKVDQALLLERAKLAPEHRVSTYGKYELHNWIHAKGSKHERAMTGTFFAPDVMVFGASSDEVMAALDVLDGTKPNFADKEPSLAGATPAGAILVAGVSGLGDVDLPCKSPLAKQAESLIMVIGENQGEVFVQGKLSVKQADVAQQIKTVVEGALAMATLAKSEDADAVKLISTVKVNVVDKAVTLESRGTAEAIWAQLQKEVANHKATHKGGHDHCPLSGHCPLDK